MPPYSCMPDQPWQFNSNIFYFVKHVLKNVLVFPGGKKLYLTILKKKVVLLMRTETFHRAKFSEKRVLTQVFKKTSAPYWSFHIAFNQFFFKDPLKFSVQKEL